MIRLGGIGRSRESGLKASAHKSQNLWGDDG